MWIDSHCHLTHEKIMELGSPEDLVNRASERKVSGMLTINCRISDEFDIIHKAAKKFDNVWCSVGTHPHEASNDQEKQISIDDIIAITHDPKVIAIGESGLDYYYNYGEKHDQIASFRKHIQACIKTQLPLVVHARDADEDIIQILKQEGEGTNLKGVMHCFSSGEQCAMQALELGFYISFSGIVTFKSATKLQDIAKKIPLDRLLVETDAPYLAPVPLRGKVNEPANVVHTGQFLSDLLDIDIQKFAKITSDNFYTLFSKASLQTKPES